jgi:predicted ATPase
MDIEAGGQKLSNLAKINVLLGKNGSGKSTVLRSLEQNGPSLPAFGMARYITPERGGQLSHRIQNGAPAFDETIAMKTFVK